MTSQGYSIRPIAPGDAAAIAHVQGTSWEESYRGLLPDAVIDERLAPSGFRRGWRERLASTEPNPIQNFVAEVDEPGAPPLVGFVSAGPTRTPECGCLGEILALYLLRDFQGRGIGRALMRAGLSDLEARALLPAQVWVLAENRTRAFYRHVGGFEFVERPCRIEAAKHLIEVSLRYDTVD